MPKLPENAVEQGAEWSTKLDLPTGPIQMTLDTNYRLGAPERGFETIMATINTSIRPSQGVPLEVNVLSQRGDGVFRFDARNGRLNDSTVKQTIEMKLKAMDREVQQVVDLKAELKLQQ
jgi:hypothetical protein